MRLGGVKGASNFQCMTHSRLLLRAASLKTVEILPAGTRDVSIWATLLQSRNSILRFEVTNLAGHLGNRLVDRSCIKYLTVYRILKNWVCLCNVLGTQKTMGCLPNKSGDSGR